MLDNILFSAVASGIKQTKIDTNNSDHIKLDLAIVILPPKSNTVGVFTKNIFCAAPVVVAKEHIKNDIRALIINSGNANAGTGVASGEVGFDNTIKICQMAAREIGIKQQQVLPFSTGVIGKQLPMNSFKNFIPELIKNANIDDLVKVSKAIMTTDTFNKISYKTFEIEGKKVNIVGISKGSGMIEPNMATMLSFIFTDIVANKKELKNALNIAVNKSFNRITVDGDTSTNDACTLSTTNYSGVKINAEFQQQLNLIMTDLAQKIVKDGEGATKFIEIKVDAATNKDCLKIAYTVANSLLVKTALFASDANWGRILAAIGRSGVKFNKNEVDIYLGKVCLIKNGEICPSYTEELGSKEVAKKEISINIKVGDGATETIWTNDLSYDYIKINAEYRT